MRVTFGSLQNLLGLSYESFVFLTKVKLKYFGFCLVYKDTYTSAVLYCVLNEHNLKSIVSFIPQCARRVRTQSLFREIFRWKLVRFSQTGGGVEAEAHVYNFARNRCGIAASHNYDWFNFNDRTPVIVKTTLNARKHTNCIQSTFIPRG